MFIYIVNFVYKNFSNDISELLKKNILLNNNNNKKEKKRKKLFNLLMK